jgi:hypothetical protein
MIRLAREPAIGAQTAETQIAGVPPRAPQAGLEADPRRASFGLSFRGRFGIDSGVGPFFPVVLYINYSPTNFIPHGFGSLVSFLADDNLFLDACFLFYDCLFLPGLYVDGAVVEGISGCSADRTVNGPPLDCHPLLTQRYTLLHRLLDRVDAHPHAALFDKPFAAAHPVESDRTLCGHG